MSDRSKQGWHRIPDKEEHWGYFINGKMRAEVAVPSIRYVLQEVGYRLRHDENRWGDWSPMIATVQEAKDAAEIAVWDIPR